MKQNAVLIISFFILSTLVNAQHAPYHESPVIYGVKFDWPSHIRLASGSDNWPITWAGDDNQYVVWGDGGGFGGTNKYGRSSIGVARIEGKWHDFKATNIWGGYNSENDHDVIGKSYGIICINNVLYMWVGMFETKIDPFKQVKIAYSKDYGTTWNFTNWSLKKKDLVMMPSLCNYGKNYQGAREEYVYSYLIRFQSYEGQDDYPDNMAIDDNKQN